MKLCLQVRIFLAVASLIGVIASRPVSAGTLAGSLSMLPAGSVADLSTEGALDWVHWGSHTEYGYDRKANVTPRIGPLIATISPSGQGPYQYSDNLTGFSWSDGAPQVLVTNTTTGIWAISRGSGFRLSVPADTTLRRLNVYVGAFQAQGQFDASLSDNSASPYSNTSIDIGDNAPGGVYTLLFAANSTGQTLTVTYVVRREHDNRVGNATWQAVTLANATANNPPSTAITSPANNANFSAGTNILLSAVASDSDGTITNVEFFQGANKLGQVSTGNYSLVWSNVPAGDYVLRSAATDNGGLSYTSPPVEIFINTNGGWVSGTMDVVPGFLDLTAQGTADWAHWGLDSSASFDHKSGVIQRISNFSPLGNNPVLQRTDYPTLFSWNDGTPTGNSSFTSTSVAIAGFTNGFLLTVPAMTYTQTLVLYLGSYASMGTVQAFLSDFSAPAFTDSSLVSYYNTAYGACTLNFAAASPNQVFTVRFVSSAQYDMTYGGSVVLAGATLSAIIPPPLPQPVLLLNPRWNGQAFSFSFQTESNRNYTVERTALLRPPGWEVLTNFPGDGGTAVISDSPQDILPHYYRVKVQ
jgi:hypothetical protein